MSTSKINWDDPDEVRAYKKRDRKQRRRDGRNEPSDKVRWKSVTKNGGSTTTRISDEQADLIFKAIHNEGLSVNAAAKRFGVTYATARRCSLGIRKLGEGGTRKKTTSPPLDEQERDAIRSSYRTGMTIEQLALQWRRGESTIRRVVAGLTRGSAGTEGTLQ